LRTLRSLTEGSKSTSWERSSASQVGFLWVGSTRHGVMLKRRHFHPQTPACEAVVRCRTGDCSQWHSQAGAWERAPRGHPRLAKRSFAPNGVPKQELGHERAILVRWSLRFPKFIPPKGGTTCVVNPVYHQHCLPYTSLERQTPHSCVSSCACSLAPSSV